MRLGKDVLEADLYGILGLLPDATESEIRVAYRRQVRASHPDLNQHDPEAEQRMARLNVAAKVLLDRDLRRAYDRAPRGPKASAPRPAAPKPWFDRSEQSSNDDWMPPPAPPAPAERHSFGSFFSELRGRESHFGLRVQELTESLSSRQQLGVAAVLFAVALALVALSRPTAFMGEEAQRTVDLGVYP